MGKGTALRDNSHFHETKQVILKSLHPHNKKLRKMVKYWRQGGSMVIRKVVHGVNSYEASSNEMAIIQTIGLNHITNENYGTCY